MVSHGLLKHLLHKIFYKIFFSLFSMDYKMMRRKSFFFAFLLTSRNHCPYSFKASGRVRRILFLYATFLGIEISRGSTIPLALIAQATWQHMHGSLPNNELRIDWPKLRNRIRLATPAYLMLEFH